MTLPAVWFIGGEDIQLRIPLLKVLITKNFAVAALGSVHQDLFNNTGITYYRYGLNRGISPLQDVLTINQLCILFRRYKPDIVHAFDTKPSLLVPIAAKKSGTPFTVRTITGMGYLFSSSSIKTILLRTVYRYLQRQASKNSNRTIFQNKDDQDYFLSTGLADPKESILIRSSGVDIDDLNSKLPTEDQKNSLNKSLGLEKNFVFIMIARMVKQKGVIEFLEAAQKVRTKLPNTRFLLVGPQAREGKQAVSSSLITQYADVVDWLNVRSDIPELLSISDVFVLPSYYREGVPRVLLEAGALGLPLITTDMPGCRDVVQNGSEGLLVAPRDSVALSEAMIKMATSDVDIKAMGASAKTKVVQNFSLKIVASSYEDVYHDLLPKN